MTTSTPIRSVFRMAIGLLFVLTIGACAVVDLDAGFGVLMGGVVMLTSFAFGGWTAGRLSKAVQGGLRGGAGSLVLLKLPALGLAIWMLLERFDPLSVVVGGSVVMIAIVLQASADAMRPAPEEAR